MVDVGAVITLTTLLGAVAAGVCVRTERRGRVLLVAIAPVVVSVLAWIGTVIAVQTSVASVPDTVRHLPFAAWVATSVAPAILVINDGLAHVFRPSTRSIRTPAPYFAPALAALTIGVLYGSNELVSAHTKFYRWRGSASDLEYWVVAACLLMAILGNRQRWVLTGASTLGVYAGWLARGRWSQLSGFYNDFAEMSRIAASAELLCAFDAGKTAFVGVVFVLLSIGGERRTAREHPATAVGAFVGMCVAMSLSLGVLEYVLATRR